MASWDPSVGACSVAKVGWERSQASAAEAALPVVRARACGLSMKGDAEGCHGSTVMCCCRLCPRWLWRKCIVELLQKNAMSAFMLLVVSQDAEFSDVAVWDVQMELATKKGHLQREKFKRAFWHWVEIWISGIVWWNLLWSDLRGWFGSEFYTTFGFGSFGTMPPSEEEMKRAGEVLSLTFWMEREEKAI